MVYIGMPDNPQFLGALKPNDVAETINRSKGPSGENREYLLQLEESLNLLSHESADEHVSDLARRVKAMASPHVLELRGQSPAVPISLHLRKANSSDEQEEIEKNP